PAPLLRVSFGRICYDARVNQKNRWVLEVTVFQPIGLFRPSFSLTKRLRNLPGLHRCPTRSDAGASSSLLTCSGSRLNTAFVRGFLQRLLNRHFLGSRWP